MEKEIWKTVDDFPNYEVSNLGNVRNKKTGKYRNPTIDTQGYKSIALTNDSYLKTVRVHVLVARMFIGPRPNGYDINHVDGNKLNNAVSNLEYCTRSDNVRHAYENRLNKLTTSIRIVETGEIYQSINECARAINASRKNIAQCLNDKYQRNTCNGYHFEYVERTDLSTDSVPIEIVETGEKFESARECERAINGAHTQILKAARNGTSYKNLHFRFVENKKENDDKPDFLYPHQREAVEKMFDGCILNGGVGSGKSRAGLYYYFTQCGGERLADEIIPMKNPLDLYIITTAKKRNDLEWEPELNLFLMSTSEDLNQYNNKIVVDSWQNIGKYTDVHGAYFIFDEDHVTGNGAWVKAFYKIAKKNRWFILSASPGDKWEDFIAVFVANGFYRNKSEFIREHITYSPYITKYPKVQGYRNTGRLIRLRNKILIDMDYDRHTVQHHEDVYCSYDIPKYKDIMRKRWDPYKDAPIEQPSALCYVLRRVVNSDENRQMKLLELMENIPRAIIFYNFDYEREILLKLHYGDDYEIAEWSGHAHEPIPDGSHWVYLVQYTAGCEGFNCIKTNTIIFYSQNYSYKTMIQAAGRVDRLNSPYMDLYYYHLKSRSGIDLAISRALSEKRNFNEMKFVNGK